MSVNTPLALIITSLTVTGAMVVSSSINYILYNYTHMPGHNLQLALCVVY